MRTGAISADGAELKLTGDFDATTNFEIITLDTVTRVTINEIDTHVTRTSYGTLTVRKVVELPGVALPNLSSLSWVSMIFLFFCCDIKLKGSQKNADSLPEISLNYSDEGWTICNLTKTNNPTKLRTEVVLYAGDYGYHTGNILWRGHFTSSGSENGLKLHMMGGAAFAYSIWLNSTFVGSWEGDALHSDHNSVWSFTSKLTKGSKYVLTILQDHMGYEQDWTAASDEFKTPRGIINYSFIGSKVTKVDLWKLSGNLGGESVRLDTHGI